MNFGEMLYQALKPADPKESEMLATELRKIEDAFKQPQRDAIKRELRNDPHVWAKDVLPNIPIRRPDSGRFENIGWNED